MNRSYSKIRHIQESNRLLENRLLNEQTTEGTLDITECLKDLTEQEKPESCKGTNVNPQLCYNELKKVGGAFSGGNPQLTTAYNCVSEKLMKNVIDNVPDAKL